MSIYNTYIFCGKICLFEQLTSKDATPATTAEEAIEDEGVVMISLLSAEDVSTRIDLPVGTFEEGAHRHNGIEPDNDRGDQRRTRRTESMVIGAPVSASRTGGERFPHDDGWR